MDPKIPINCDIWSHKNLTVLSSEFKIACWADLALEVRVWYPIPKLQPDLDHTSGIPDLTSMSLDYSPPIPDPTPLIHDATY